MWVIVGLFTVNSIYYVRCYLCHNILDVIIVTNFNCQKFDVVTKKEALNMLNTLADFAKITKAFKNRKRLSF